jgi:RND family efflux transporter MFP subunit
MKNILLLVAAFACLWMACKNEAHEEKQKATAAPPSELEALTYTVYSDKTELFVDTKPLVVGQESRFITHLTTLGDLFKAVDKGSVTLSLSHASGNLSISADKPDNAGVFILKMTPSVAGVFSLVFDIKTPTYSDKITIENVRVYPNLKTAMAEQKTEEAGANDITFLKEQAWQVDFANAPAKIQPFSEVVKTTGQIIAAPDDEAAMTAQISGIVSFSGKNTVAGSAVKAGQNFFSIRSNQVVESNLGAAVQQAEQDMAIAKRQFDRASELVNDKLITQKEFLEAKLRYENAQIILNNAGVSKNFNQSRQSVAAPISGFLKNILVENGQFVQAGQTLATISKNKRLILKADIAQKHFSKLASFTAANFKTAGSDVVHNTRQLNGRVVSFGKSTVGNSPFVPLHFEIDNAGNFINGSVVEVFLQTGIKSALVIPTTALLEEQGLFYAYIQTKGETFQKRELKLGTTDGLNVEVLSGIAAGERVVTKGVYQIKLATASGTMPEHSHEH